MSQSDSESYDEIDETIHYNLHCHYCKLGDVFIYSGGCVTLNMGYDDIRFYKTYDSFKNDMLNNTRFFLYPSPKTTGH